MGADFVIYKFEMLPKFLNNLSLIHILTLKSKGLLSMMLSLPDEWNYTTRGLAAICREGVDSIEMCIRDRSYTRLGMAALLPHKTLEMTDDFQVLADGILCGKSAAIPSLV